MLYLIGGTPRSGKSVLARKLLTDHHVPCFPVDLLMMGLARGWPDAGVDPAAADSVVGERLWPVLRGMALTLIEDGLAYALEGAQLQPAHVAELLADHPILRCTRFAYAFPDGP